MQHITADVIVVGGGGAGTSATLKLQELGLRPIIVSKGPVGKSGASIMAGSLIVGGNSLGAPKKMPMPHSSSSQNTISISW
jgi:succinate dehydrogenase / fumarate reductase, flavoprotein subunit